MRAIAVLALLLGCSSGKSPGSDSAGPQDSADDTGDTATRVPIQGLLQFKVEHNLETDDCLARGDCHGQLEETDDVAGWLADIATDSTAPVLHWDRPIPWDVMATAAPSDADPAAFHDARLDPDLVAWVDAFATRFSAQPGGYLAVSMLDGDRASPAPLWLGSDASQPVGSACMELGPGTRLDIDGEPVELSAAYAEFIRYLHAKLSPERLGLMVEVNMYETLCPSQWPAMVALYHDIFDRTRATVGPEPALFATFTLVELLGYDPDACFGGLNWTACDDPVADPPEVTSGEACFPLHTEPLLELADGDRMDILALSFYPHSMDLSPPDVVLDLSLWEGGDEPAGDCSYQARHPNFSAGDGPLDQLDRLPWDGPMALAETSARGCSTWAYIVDGTSGTHWWVDSPGSEANQEWWVRRLVEVSREREMDMLVGAFRNDYAPMGPWLVRDEVMDPSDWGLLNHWACSGIRQADGTDKTGITELWQSW